MPMALPESLELIRHPDYIEIVRSWFGWHIIFLVFFCVFWDGFLFFWYAMAFEEGNIIMLLFPVLHMVAGVGLTYYTLAVWKNKTYIYASQLKISIFHKPFPWFGNTELMVAELKQLYVKEKVSRGKNGSTVTYELHAILKSDKDRKLIGGLPEPGQAQYIEQELEKYLRIKDIPVRGQFQ